jgi:EmrB/QacA subfamily drug resistance transporter
VPELDQEGIMSETLSGGDLAVPVGTERTAAAAGETAEAAAPETAGSAEATAFRPPKGSWAVMFTVLGASMMDLLDATVMNVAAPSIRTELKASDTAYQWINIGYIMSFAVLLIAGGRLGDIVGRRRMFLGGLTGFVVMSAVCAIAQNPGELITARLLQGACSAMMIPQGIGMIREAFGREGSQKAFAIFGPFMGLSAMLGPIIGGALITYSSWRWVFVINIPAGLVALFFGSRVLPTVHHRDGDRPKLDVIGLILCSAAVGLLVYPVIEGREKGWPAWTYLMMVSSALVLGLFSLYARYRHKAGLDPFIETSLFRKRAFTTGTMTIFLFFGACSGVFLVSTLLLQLYMGWSPLRAGLTGAWWSLGTIIAMGAGQAFVKKTPRRVLHAGLLLLAVGLSLTALTIAHYKGSAHFQPGVNPPPGHFAGGLTSWNLAPSLIISGVGMGLVFAPFFGLVLSAVDDHELGSANGVISAFDQLGGAVASAVMSTVFFNRVEKKPVGSMAPFASAQTVYWLSAGILVLTWALAFTVPKTARSEDEIMV